MIRDRKAYKAMFHFLKDRNKRLPSDALSQLLSELNLHFWNDGSPADPAIAADWDQAVELAELEESSIRKTESPMIRRAS